MDTDLQAELADPDLNVNDRIYILEHHHGLLCEHPNGGWGCNRQRIILPPEPDAELITQRKGDTLHCYYPFAGRGEWCWYHTENPKPRRTAL